MTLPDTWTSAAVALLGSAMVLSLGGLGMMLYSARMTKEAVSRRVDLVTGQHAAAPRKAPLASTLIRTGHPGADDAGPRILEAGLKRLGVPAALAIHGLVGVRLVMIALMATCGYAAARHWAPGPPMLPPLAAAGLGIAGWFLPAMALGRLVSRRKKAVVAGLPDALELLVICVEAGLSFEDGIDRIAGLLAESQPALAGELALTAADLKILPSREQALANLGDRVDTPSVRSIVTTLSQTLRYGTPLAQALRVVANQLRNDTLLHLEERANQLPTLMTIPMMLFIMPTIFMIVGGPAVLRVIDVLQKR